MPLKSNFRITAPARMAGMSLMEILIAMAIGLIGIVVITQTYLVNENYKRSTTSAGGAQTNGALALFSIEREARMAGWGISWSTALGCTNIQWFYNGDYSSPPGGGLPVLTLAPIVITDGGAGPDTITIMYGSGTERVIPATLSKSMPSPSAELEVDNPQGFSDTPGDMVLLVQGGTCSMTQITQVQPAAGHLQHGPGVTAPYNPPGGGSLLPAFSAGAQVFNLGRPTVNVYSISNNALQLATLFSATSSTVVPAYTPTPFTIVDNIVDLQAEYGKDNGVNNGTVGAVAYTANDGIVDSYDNVTPANGVEWQQVLSVRIGVLARSEHFVKPENVGDPCSATTAAPTWRGGAFAVPGGIPSCYGYRVFETVVPLRNMIWRQG
ncbi:MAG TPA: PilW family protein [Burkholderiales bacterium]|nr:PilW family protein [Burkholderiales bacterium]